MRTSLIGGFAACVLVVAGCNDTPDPSAAAKSFKRAAEKAIIDDVDATLVGDASAECDYPTSTKIGSTFSCIATASDGKTYEYLAEITSDQFVEVNSVLGIDDQSAADTTAS